MDDDFHDWSEEYSPFDAIGFVYVGPEPPHQQDFAKAVRYARFVTEPARVRNAGAAAAGLPYARDQVDKAVRYFTAVPTTEPGDETLNGVVWEWAYHDIIDFKANGQYQRTWAPEKRHWDSVIFDSPSLINTDNQNSFINSTSASSITSATPSDETHAQIDRRSYTPSIFAIASDTEDSNRSLSLLALRHQRSDSQDVFFAQPRLGNIGTMTVPLNRARYRSYRGPRGTTHRPRAGSYQPHVRIVVGFHREQITLAGRFTIPAQDYRQTVVAVYDTKGDTHMRLRGSNLAGNMVPDEHRLAAVATSVPHGDIYIYRNIYRNMLG